MSENTPNTRQVEQVRRFEISWMPAGSNQFMSVMTADQDDARAKYHALLVMRDNGMLNSLPRYPILIRAIWAAIPMTMIEDATEMVL